MAITLTTDGTWTISTKAWLAGTVVASRFGYVVYQFDGLPADTSDTFANTVTLTLPGLSVVSGTPTLTAYGVVSRHAAPVSGDTIGRYLLAEIASLAPTGGPTDWVITGSMALGATTAQRIAAGGFNQAWRSSYRDANNDLARTLLIVVQTVGAGSVAGTSGAATLVVGETTARTGLVGQRYVRDAEKGIGVQLVECSKCSAEIAVDEAVMDGYSRRLVCPECYDRPLPRPGNRRGTMERQRIVRGGVY